MTETDSMSTSETKERDIIEELTVDEEDILDGEQKIRLKSLLRTHKDIFPIDDIDIGECNLVKHRIDLENDIPFKHRLQ